MFGVIELTIRKLKEPAFTIMLFIGVMLGYMVSGISSVEDDAASSLLTQIIMSNKGLPVISSSFFALGITIVMAVFTGTTEIPRDIETGAILLILSKPVSKTEYLAGKFLGVLILCAVMFTLTQLSIFTTNRVYSNEGYSFLTILRQFYLFLPVIPMVALAVAVSCFVPDISAMVVTVLYVLFSLFFSIVPLAIALLPKSLSVGVEAYVLIFYYFFPNFIYFFQNIQLFGLVALALLLYSLSIAFIFLVIAADRINRRDLI
jgi:ABC-type transport system involved in multi-copper enzyme maturation permease subunit